MSLRVLVVEAEARATTRLDGILTEHGLEVSSVAEPSAAHRRIDEPDVDVVVLHRCLTGADGAAASAIRALRHARPRTPLLVVAASWSDDQIVRALESGADDVIAAPVSTSLLLARLRAAARRIAPTAGDVLTAGDLTFDRGRRRLFGRRGEITVTAKEYRILDLLMTQVGRVVPRPTLLRAVWGYDFDPGTNVADVAVSRLRRKIRDVSDGATIRAVRAQGVVLDAMS